MKKFQNIKYCTLKKASDHFLIEKSKTVRWFYYNLSLIHSQCNSLWHFQFTVSETDKVIRLFLIFQSIYYVSLRGLDFSTHEKLVKNLSHALAKQHRNSFLYTLFSLLVTHYLLKLSYKFFFSEISYLQNYNKKVKRHSRTLLLVFYA